MTTRFPALKRRAIAMRPYGTAWSRDMGKDEAFSLGLSRSGYPRKWLVKRRNPTGLWLSLMSTLGSAFGATQGLKPRPRWGLHGPPNLSRTREVKPAPSRSRL